jgi:hypothetical protein
MPFKIDIRPTGPTGQVTNEAHGRCRYTDSVVAEARAIRATGASFSQVSLRVQVPEATVRRWCQYTSRKAPAKHVVRVRKVAP